MSGTAQYLEDLDAHMRIAGFEPSDTDAFASTWAARLYDYSSLLTV